jgi:hypothetical protein
MDSRFAMASTPEWMASAVADPGGPLWSGEVVQLHRNGRQRVVLLHQLGMLGEPLLQRDPRLLREQNREFFVPAEIVNRFGPPLVIDVDDDE